ncbi:MAG: cytosine deaminase [Hyphomicrobiales bacterium]
MPSLSLPNGPVTLDNLVIPGPLIGSQEALVSTSVTIRDGRFSDAQAEQRIDMVGQMVLPAFVDMHTHLDKGHIWPRTPNPDGTFDGALSSVGQDREAKWSAEDVRARMTFALESAYAHGTKAVRTHLDSIPPQDEISWGVFDEVRADWKGKIDLQAVSLVGADGIEPDGTGRYQVTADIVSKYGGVLGMVTYPLPDLEQRLEAFFQMATQRNLDADFHVDETGDPSVATLRQIAQMVLKTGYKGKVVCGHCCSLAVQDESEADRTMDLVAEAGLTIVSLPLCNLYLQDRDPGRTPRWRGVTLVHEMKARGIPVAFASDNTRDPFYAYGDLDMVEVMRETTRIAHLDHTSNDWVSAFTTTPAVMCDFEYAPFSAGAPADFVLFNARSWNEFMARPQTNRTVMRDGKVLTLSPPDYAVLDPLME